jgi:5'-nucleotidase
VVAPLALGALASPANAATPVDVQILATNDFHGRINRNPTGAEGGAAAIATAVDQFRATNPNTVFAAAGDLIGASTFESFIAHDKPTIDALNEAGLEVSSVGNHEFDQGYDDLVNRVMAAESPSNPDGGAAWQYLAANIDEPGTNDFIPDTWTRTFNTGTASEVKVGFVGAVTEHLPELVSPAGMEGVAVTDIVDATNTAANALKAGGADLVVLLVHEGAPNTTCATMDDDSTSDFGSIITGVNDNVDAIVSGHTHLAYNCSFPVAGWAGRAVTERPVVSAGQYGANLNQLEFTVDADTGLPTALTQNIVAMQTKDPAPATTWTANYPGDAATAQIVSDANAEAEVLGAQPLGQIEDAFYRARKANGIDENRGGESTLGNLVAEVQRWATSSDTAGNAQIAFMNPGGLRDNMLGNNSGGYPATLTYKQAAVVQPFANTLVNMQMTGDQIRQVLEQQWQPGGASRPFLRLGVSKGFRYTYDPTAAAGSRITKMWLDGTPIAPTDTFSVTANSFLASGGDNFGAFSLATHKHDTGRVDLQAMVDYMDEFGSATPVQADFAQHAIGMTPPTLPAGPFAPGDDVSFDLSSLAMTGPGDLQDDELSIRIGGREFATVPVDNAVIADIPGTPGNETNDEAGTASVDVNLPRYVGDPDQIVVVGPETGTRLAVPLDTTEQAKAAADMTVTRAPDRVVVDKTRTRIKVKVESAGDPATGRVTVTAGGRTYNATLDETGRAVVELRPFGNAGKKNVRVEYHGDYLTNGATDTVTFTVHKT